MKLDVMPVSAGVIRSIYLMLFKYASPHLFFGSKVIKNINIMLVIDYFIFTILKY